MILCPWEGGGGSFDVLNARLSKKDCWTCGWTTRTITEIAGRLCRQKESCDMPKSMKCILGSVGKRY